MPHITVDLPKLVPTSSGSSVTNAIGKLDDAANLSVFMVSTALGATTAASIQVSQFDPVDGPLVGVTNSTAFNVLSTALGSITSSGAHIMISNIAFRGLRISGLSSSVAADIVAFVSKQISV